MEHIIPQSLGNLKQVLPRGLVCDGCNNYFGRKIEGPLLATEYFTQTRFRNALLNKRGLIPSVQGILGPLGIEIGFGHDAGGTKNLYTVRERDFSTFRNYIEANGKFECRVVIPNHPQSYLFSRFIAKVSLEVLTQKVMALPSWEDDVVFRTELDEIRQYARYGGTKTAWPISTRRIYAEHHRFRSETGELYESLHEFMLLLVTNGDAMRDPVVEVQLLAVIAILGVEYVINLGSPETATYERWLKDHDGISPLYYIANSMSD